MENMSDQTKEEKISKLASRLKVINAEISETEKSLRVLKDEQEWLQAALLFLETNVRVGSIVEAAGKIYKVSCIDLRYWEPGKRIPSLQGCKKKKDGTFMANSQYVSHYDQIRVVEN